MMRKSKAFMFPNQIQSDLSAMSFRRGIPVRKKYTLHKMKEIPESQNFKASKRNKGPTYFTDMLRQQKKKQNVNTFIKKLKNSIQLQNPSTQNAQFLQKCQSNNSDFRNLLISKPLYFGFLISLCIQNILLLVLISLSIIFEQIAHYQQFRIFVLISAIVHFGEMLKKSYFNLDYDENKKQTATKTMKNYINSSEFILDTIIFICIILQTLDLTVESLQYLTKIIICIKVKNVLEIQSYLEIALIQNEYRQQVWSLIKVFIFNFIFAHILTIFLVLMSKLHQSQNWILIKQLDYENFSEIYIWAYYWATTIMLTVGFGDLVPRNTNQAFCMIFIQTLSCIVLAYNINQLGNIIQKIRSYDLQQINNMKIFNQMNEITDFSKESKEKITNYIKQSTIIKRDFNLQQQQVFLSKLPVTFKNQLCKQMHRPIWNGITFFQNLSQRVLLDLSVFIEKKLAHPQQIVYSKGSLIQVMLFNHGKFGFAYQNGRSKRNGQIIHEFQLGNKQYKLSTLDFLTQNQLSYDIRCLDYSLVYKISVENLVKILKGNEYDHEYYFMMKDKDRYLMNQFQLLKCQFCPKQRHTLFKCPKCHYIPLKKHVIDKHRLKKTQKFSLLYLTCNRKAKTQFKTLKNFYEVVINSLKKRFQFQNQPYVSFNGDQSLNLEELSGKLLLSSSKQIQSMKNIKKEVQFMKQNYSEDSRKTQNDFMLRALSKVQSNIKNQLHQKRDFWQIQSDKMHNFKYYFKNFNASSYDSKNRSRGQYRIQY